MAKICVVGDVHWSTYSSIVRSRNGKCSTRLCNLLSTVNWVERTAAEAGCDFIVYLGDFFDRCDLNPEEITILQDVEWSSMPHYFIVGNHESPMASLEFNSTKALQRDVFHIVSSPTILMDRFVLIPYLVEDKRKDLRSYVGCVKDAIVLSHNDIKGIQYGCYTSQQGFSLTEIAENCRLFINGHLHNQKEFHLIGEDGSEVSLAINLGNITGQNFNEDAFEYPHQIMVLDSDSMGYELIDNPNAMNFYKLDVMSESDIAKVSGMKANAVLSVKCVESLKDRLEEAISEHGGVIAYKVVPCRDQDKGQASGDVGAQSIASMDHLQKFREFVIEKLGAGKAVTSELSEVCK